uniref:Transmembrane protein n=1 Tax=Strongyloides venezuelensis TaxID=75913 RepID=A0A0K0G5F3_STRVS
MYNIVLIFILCFLTNNSVCIQGDYKNVSISVYVRNNSIPHIFHEVLNNYFDYGFKFKKKYKNFSIMEHENKICHYIFIIDFNVVPIDVGNYICTFIYWNTKYNNVTIKDNKNILYLKDQDISDEHAIEKIVKNSLIFSNADERCTINFEFSMNYLYKKKLIFKAGYIILILFITLLPLAIVIFKQ